jgi:hypothetical protein
VLAVAFSPDRKILATGGADRRALLWDLTAGRELRRLEGHSGAVTQLIFSPDGKYLASASVFAPGGIAGLGDMGIPARDPMVSWWEVATGKEVHQFRSGASGARALGLSPDGKELTVIDLGRGLHRWDVATGKGVTLSAPLGLVTALAPDGKTLASAGAGVEVHDLTRATMPRRLEGELRGGNVSRIRFAPDGRTLVTSGPAGQLQLWDVVGGRSLRLLRPREQNRILGSQSVTPVFSPNGKVMAVPSVGGSVSLVEVASGKDRQVLSAGGMPVICVAFSADGTSLAAGRQDGTALVWTMPRATAAKGKLTEKELEAQWEALAGHDVVPAHEAIQALTAAGAQAVPLLKKWLPPETPVAREPDVGQLIAQVSNKDLKVRKQAQAELAKRWEKVGMAVKAPLVKALAAKPSLDVKLRLEKLLRELGDRQLSPEEVRVLRALEAVEAMPAKVARPLLEAWAKGAPGALLTEESRSALARSERMKDE